MLPRNTACHDEKKGTNCSNKGIIFFLEGFFALTIHSFSPCIAQVLIVSTDPAHNLSDAFCQKIGREPTPIAGFDNLCAMEIDAQDDLEEMQRDMQEAAGEEEDTGVSSLMAELTSSIPGIDEAMSFSELMKQVQQLDYEVVVFDTAPTGHTLRLLSFPTILEKALGKVMDLKDRFGGLIGQAAGMMGGSNPGQMQDMLVGRLEETRTIINKVNDAFQDPALTTFVSETMVSWQDFDLSSQHVSLDFRNLSISRFAFVSRNFCPFTRRNAWYKSYPSLALTPTTLLSIRSCSPKRMPKSWESGSMKTRAVFQKKPGRSVRK